MIQHLWTLNLGETAWWQEHSSTAEAMPKIEALQEHLESGGIDVISLRIGGMGTYLLTTPDDFSHVEEVWKLFDGSEVFPNPDIEILRQYLNSREDVAASHLAIHQALQAIIRLIIPPERA